MLAHQLDDLAQSHRQSRDFTLSTLREALRQVIACFPVYRSYIAGGQVSMEDRRYIKAAIEQAKPRNSIIATQVTEFLHDMLLLNYLDRATDADREAQQRFVGKFQQLTAPVMAKGIEDTAFYCYHRFISLNEVGGDPNRFGVETAELHDYLYDRQAHWPHALSALSTHDTKRSEDVRARLNVLSEIPQRWRDQVEQ
jgi:(1->4)-alpha-D-glucan 1-alpha-D-glucosylmutase